MHPTDEALHLVAVALLVVAAVLDLALIYLLKALSAGDGGRDEYVDEFRIILLLMGLGALYFAAQVWATDPARLHLLVDSATGPGSLVALVAAAVAMELWLLLRLWRRRRRIFARARARTRHKGGGAMDAATHAMPAQAYVFPARALRAIDGDTIDVRLSLGLHEYRVERLRLAGVNCPEVHGATREAGAAAQRYTLAWLVEGQGGDTLLHDAPTSFPLLVQTYKSDVFGRYIALVWRAYDNRCLNDDLVASGNAEVFMPGPVTP